MTDDPMKARAREWMENVWEPSVSGVWNDYDMLAAFATKERSDARREGMEAAAKIASMFHRGFGGSPTWGAKTAGDIERAIRALIAEEAKHDKTT